MHHPIGLAEGAATGKVQARLKSTYRPCYRLAVMRLTTYAGVGVIGTTAHYLVLVLLVDALYIAPLYATSVGFVVGALVNYAMNYRFTFMSDRRHRETLPKFYVVAAVGFLLNGMVMFVLTEVFSLPYLAAQVAATGIVLVWGFGANSRWTFGQSPKD